MSKDEEYKNYDFGYSIALFSIKYPIWQFPLSIALTFVPVCLSAYISAVLHQQVPIFVPFISECITYPPQASYFTLYSTFMSLFSKFHIKFL